MQAKAIRKKSTGEVYLITRSGQLINYGIGEDARLKALKAVKESNARHDRNRLMLDLGLERVKGALGGAYYE